MRKMSKAAKAAQYDALKKERDAFAEYAWCMVNGVAPDAIERVNDKDATYTMKLYASLRSHGGIVACIFASDVNESKRVEVIFFEDWLRSVAELLHGVGVSTEIRIAAERLTLKRSAIYDAERGSREAERRRPEEATGGQ